jgi:hypothetical protein
MKQTPTACKQNENTQDRTKTQVFHNDELTSNSEAYARRLPEKEVRAATAKDYSDPNLTIGDLVLHQNKVGVKDSDGALSSAQEDRMEAGCFTK